jgi:hypothetical protein
MFYALKTAVTQFTNLYIYYTVFEEKNQQRNSNRFPETSHTDSCNLIAV